MGGSLYKGYGKFYGWKFLAAIWVIYCLMQGIVLYGASVVNTFTMMDLGFSRGVLGAGVTVYQICGSVAAPLVTWVIDRKGIRFSMLAGSVVVLVSCLILALFVSDGTGYIVAYGVLSGLGMALAGMLPLQVGVNHWFREKRALAMAVSLTGSGVGGFLSGSLFNAINASFGWHACWWFVAITTVATVLIVLTFVVNRPEDIGQIPDGRDWTGEPSSKRFSKVYKTAGNLSVRRVMRDYRIWIIILSLVFMRFSYNICVSQGMAHLLDQNLDTVVAASAVGAMTLIGVAGRLASGSIGDKIEPRWLWAAGMIVMGGGIACLWLASSPTHVWAFAALVGVGFGFSYVSSTVIIANYYGADTYTLLMAFVFPAQFILGSLGPTFAGIVYDVMGNYSLAFCVSLALVGVSAVLVLLASPPRALADGEKDPKR